MDSRHVFDVPTPPPDLDTLQLLDISEPRVPQLRAALCRAVATCSTPSLLAILREVAALPEGELVLEDLALLFGNERKDGR